MAEKVPFHPLVKASGGQNDDFRPLTYTLGGGAWGAGTNMWHPKTLASYESLPAPLATQIPTLWIKAVNREDILSRRYRDRDLAKFESSRRYRER
jgi:hypothetical protein